MAKPSTKQIKQIHYLKSRLRMDTEMYQAALQGYNREATSSLHLNPVEADQMIRDLQTVVDRNQAPSPAASSIIMTEEQRFRTIKRILFHGLFCAIHYAPMPRAVLDDGQIAESNELRTWLLNRFLTKRAIARSGDAPPTGFNASPLPRWALQRLHTDWLNPKVNEFLRQHGFACAQPEKYSNLFYPYKLPSDALKYLATRFKLMYEGLLSQTPTRA